MKYIFHRILLLIPILFLLSIITFSLSHVSSGDPARVIAEKEYGRPTLGQIQKIRIMHGLDKPFYQQYIFWMKKVLNKDFGISYKTSRPVMEEIQERVTITIKLSLVAFLILIGIAIPMGIFCALYPNSLLDKMCQVVSFTSVSIPSFLVGLILLYIFGVKLQCISVLGCMQDYIMIPAFTLAFSYIGIVIGLINTSMRQVLKQDYIRSARAKGIGEWKIIFKHSLKNAILPVMTQMSMIFCSFLSGSAIIESIFSVQGLGKLILDSVAVKDIPVIQAFVMLIAIFIVLINLMIDILYQMIDPRIKLD
ncbi:ABC transporter permease [Inediibacterium massiliense]|uniref:ABC transporter permease n=1 Tax=Inediibacterium massiliense TaxID=1658111 RepID=UPI000DA634F2|nr:ABC transporter permease [Inediibacterium massiliense]